MNFIHKIKETAIAIVPISALVVALSLTVAPVPPSVLFAFMPGSILVLLGLSFFLAGTDLGILPAGSFIGSAITKSKSILLVLFTGLLVGFFITVAEPDLAVLGAQVERATGYIPSWPLILSVAGGVGVFVTIALLRAIIQIPFRVVTLAGYALVFVLASRVHPQAMAIAFDSGGATTGPMTVPFIIALGVGVAAVRGDRSSDEDSFGFTGIASIGPILAVALLALSLEPRTAEAAGALDTAGAAESGMRAAERALADGGNGLARMAGDLLALYSRELGHVAGNVALALSPIAVLLFAYQFFLLRLPPMQVRRIALGVVYAYVGLVLFFLGTETAFIPAGRELGRSLAAIGNGWPLIPVGLALGAAVVCAEPAIWILTEQVEEVSAGNIRRHVLLAALATGVSLAVALSLWRVLSGFGVWYLLAPSYALALALTFVSPRLFTAIAFDSGGVASGPMSSTFVLALALGAASERGSAGATDAFGLIAMIAVTPIVSIQLLGWLYARKERAMLRKETREGGSR